jgi:glycine/D-amino acid oxidase-like deaminating enzyme
MFPELVSRIEKDGAMNVEYRVQQGLRPAFTEEEAVELRATGERWLDAPACREVEPALSHEVLGGVLLEHAHLTPPRFVRALARAAATHRADIQEGMPATGFDIAEHEVRRVLTAAGAREVDWAVIAAGPWSREVASAAGVDVDVRPQRGQLTALDPGATVLNRSLFCRGLPGTESGRHHVRWRN